MAAVVTVLMMTLMLVSSSPLLRGGHLHVTVSRNHKGDMFYSPGAACEREACVGASSGTARAAEGQVCTCQCQPHLPVYREDHAICVEDVHECALASFVSGTTIQRIPFVFLPLRGQIVYPSAEIAFSDMTAPICVVSGAQFLTRVGWVDLRNNTYTEPPFRLFRDEGRTFLQWLGDSELRLGMEGRLILVHLMCKDVASSLGQSIFTPCVAFRVAGTPSPRSVSFGAGSVAANNNNGLIGVGANQVSPNPSSGLTASEYVAIAVCSVLLGLIYVASVLMYLHVRRRRRRENAASSAKRNLSNGGVLTGPEEGLIKSNPLLAARHHRDAAGVGYLSDSGSCCSVESADPRGSDEADPVSDDSTSHGKNIQITAAMIHSNNNDNNNSCRRSYRGGYNRGICHSNSCAEGETYCTSSLASEGATIERLPEENVSIVETLELQGREDRPETVRAITCATARRKLYFNPAYFEPELLLAPPPAAIEFLTKIREVIAIAKHKMQAKRFSPTLAGIPEEDSLSGTSLKRQNSRTSFNRTEQEAVIVPPPCCPSNESKHRSIRKWLENVPSPPQPPPPPPTRSTSTSKPKSKAPPPPPPPPPPPIKSPEKRETFKPSPFTKQTEKESLAVKKPKGLPEVPKKLMDAVIKELVVQRGLETKPSSPTPPSSGPSSLTLEIIGNAAQPKEKERPVQYEADSLERTIGNGHRTPTEYGASPTFSNAALPMEEEMTMRNDIFNTKTGAKTISKLKPPVKDDHEYETIDSKDLKMLSLPELLTPSGTGYSLVSEVYVNNGYNFGSASNSPTNTSTASSGYGGQQARPGRLTIQLENGPDYPDCEDSDSFEPDTLDRNTAKKLKFKEFFVDSLERPSHNGQQQILLRTSGSFQRDSARPVLNNSTSFKKKPECTHQPMQFNSLRELFEASRIRPTTRSCADAESIQGSVRSANSDTDYNYFTLSFRRGSGLTLASRHNRRQRNPTPPGSLQHSSPPVQDSIYQEPPPPRPLHVDRPPLPPKKRADPAQRPLPPLPVSDDSLNSEDYEAFYTLPYDSTTSSLGPSTLGHKLERSLNERFPKKDSSELVKKTWRRIIRGGCKPGDSGYLSTDSNESLAAAAAAAVASSTGGRGRSETDDSLCEAGSESGAESIATDSFFFGQLSPMTQAHVVPSTASSDSETQSMVTVLPPGGKRRSSMRLH